MLGVLLSKKKIVLYIILIACVIGVYAVYGMINNESEPGINGTQIEQAFAAEPSDVIQEEWMADEVTYDENKYTNVAVEYKKKLEEQGFSNIWERKQFIEDKNIEYQDKATTDIDSLGEYISEDNQVLLKEYAENICSAQTCKKIQENEVKYKGIIEKAEQAKKEEEERIAAEKARQARQSSQQNYYSGGKSGVLTRSGGVNYYNGRKETWYSEHELAGGGLNIPGRHVRDDGVICDKDGYVVVAASDTKKGTVVDTSLGAGKVYDCGCANGTNDIYTSW